MTFFLHVRRNIGRNPGRTAGVVLVVGLTLGIFLVLSQLGAAIAAGANQAVATVPNLVSIEGYQSAPDQPVQANITSQTVAAAQSTPNVVSVQRILNFPLSQASCLNGPCTRGGSGTSGASASCPFGATVTAVDTSSTLRVLGGLAGAADVNVTQGRALNAGDENSTNALVGEGYADENNLGVGGYVDIGGQNFQIVGIFSGSGCNADGIIVPYPAIASFFGVKAPNILYVTVDKYQDVAGVVSHLQSVLGSKYTVQDVSTVEHSQFLGGLSTVIFSSELGEYASLATGAAVMVVLMVFVMSRRVKEVGLLKALGYGNGRILGQLMSESLIIASIGFPLAILLTYLVGPALTAVLLSQTGGVALVTVVVQGNPLASSIHFALTPGTVALGAAVTIGFGVVGALYPAIRAVRLRPAEALRHE